MPSYSASAVGFNSPPFINFLAGTTAATAWSDSRTGFAVGGGVDWMILSNWIFRAEYLYLDFGKVTANALINDPNNPAHTGTNNLATTVDLTAQVVRAGVNYKF